MKRDIAERGRELMGVLAQYSKFVKPAFDEYIYPTMKYADMIIPRGLDNVAAIDLITKHVSRQLNDRGLPFLKSQLTAQEVDQPLPENCKLLKMTTQLKAILTNVRCVETKKDDFTFYAERLARLVVQRYYLLITSL